jgi:hypothetical protein
MIIKTAPHAASNWTITHSNLHKTDHYLNISQIKILHLYINFSLLYLNNLLVLSYNRFYNRNVSIAYYVSLSLINMFCLELYMCVCWQFQSFKYSFIGVVECKETESLVINTSTGYDHVLVPSNFSQTNSLRSVLLIFSIYSVEVVSRVSAVGIATGYELDDWEVGVRVPVGTRIFTSSCRPDRLWGPPNLL